MFYVFNLYLTVFINFQIIIFKSLSHFFYFVFSNCYRAFFLSHIFSSDLQVILFSVSPIRRYFDLVNKFFLIGHNVLDVINNCCYCYLFLLFVLTCFPNNGRSQQSNASSFNSLSCLQLHITEPPY